MMGRYVMPRAHSWVLMTVLVLTLAQLGVESQSVVINGLALVTSRSPVNVSGSIMLPMRDVFEALQSEVKWFSAEQKVMAIRGQTTIELWVGRTQAMVNGQPMQLPVAPTLIDGSTYVPLRFPAEAFGGTVTWIPATKTAVIDIPPLPEGGAGGLPPTPPGPSPAPRTVEGTLLQAIASPPTLVLSVSGTGLAQAVSLTPATVLTRHPEGQPAQPAALADGVAGDYARVVLAEDGTASSVDLTFGEKEGTVAGISDNAILLQDNTVMQLSPTVTVKDPSGQPMALSGLRVGSSVVLRYQPASQTVWEISMVADSSGPVAEEGPKILVVGILNESPILRGGQTVQVQLQGTPGGTATMDIGRMVSGLAMREVTPGIYQGEWQIPADTNNSRGVRLTGKLSVRGVAAAPVESSTRLIIDSTPPQITAVFPDPGARVENTRPTIGALFADPRGSGINPNSARLTINDRVVTANIEVTAEGLTHVPERMRPGRKQVVVTVEDMAGNRAERSWEFMVELAEIITGATFSPQGTLTMGDVLVVTMDVARVGGRAWFDLGANEENEMTRVPGENQYRGQLPITQAHQGDDVPLTVYYDDPIRGRAELRLGTVDINAVTLPTELAITSPANNSKVADTIQVFGQAPPGQNIRVTITFRKKVIANITGQLWQGVVTSSSAGEWNTPEIDSDTFFGRADEYLVVAQQLDAAGAVVASKQIRLVK